MRTDHLQVLPQGTPLPWGALHMQAVVTDVEYQGTYVLLGLQKQGVALSANATAAYSVMVSEAAFAAQPYAVGQAVQPALDARAGPSPLPAGGTCARARGDGYCPGRAGLSLSHSFVVRCFHPSTLQTKELSHVRRLSCRFPRCCL